MQTKTMTSKGQQLLTAKQMAKIAKAGQPIFLAVVRTLHDGEAHGMMEKTKRDQMKVTGPKKDFTMIQQRTEEILE